MLPAYPIQTDKAGIRSPAAFGQDGLGARRPDSYRSYGSSIVGLIIADVEAPSQDPQAHCVCGVETLYLFWQKCKPVLVVPTLGCAIDGMD